MTPKSAPWSGRSPRMSTLRAHVLLAAEALEAVCHVRDPQAREAGAIRSIAVAKRQVANHNPHDWKAARIGSYLLVGEEPPTPVCSTRATDAVGTIGLPVAQSTNGPAQEASWVMESQHACGFDGCPAPVRSSAPGGSWRA